MKGELSQSDAGGAGQGDERIEAGIVDQRERPALAVPGPALAGSHFFEKFWTSCSSIWHKLEDKIIDSGQNTRNWG
jgi:hypothetical protein